MTSHLISELPIPLAVAGHHQPAPFYLTANMFGGMPVQIAGGELSDKVDHPVAAPHTHPVDEIYLVVSPSAGGCEIEIRLDEEFFTVVSPAVFHVPAGAVHCFVTKRAELGSYCFGILLGAEVS